MTRVRHSPRLEPDRTDWRASAACLGIDPRLFFPEPRTGGGEADKERIHGQVKRAKGVCRMCPVIDDCREYAIKNDELGVWGGTTYDERKKIRRNRKRKKVA